MYGVQLYIYTECVYGRYIYSYGWLTGYNWRGDAPFFGLP